MKTESAKEMIAISVGVISHQQSRDLLKTVFGPDMWKALYERQKMKKAINDFMSQMNKEQNDNSKV
jgi:hypothetical protein